VTMAFLGVFAGRVVKRFEVFVMSVRMERLENFDIHRDWV